jgi:hypothetical protein
MTSNTPDHEGSDAHTTTPTDEHGAPSEPVQPVSADEVYDGDARGADSDGAHSDGAHSDSAHSDGGFSGEEREPYPVGAVDAEPAPATADGSNDDIVIDYGSAQEPESADDASHGAVPALTKPSPVEEQHPYPPQALGDPEPAASTPVAGAAGAAATAATTTTDRDRDRDRDDAPTDRTTDATSRPVYVQAPTPPKKKGNRGFGVLVGVLATLVFGALYLLALVFVVPPLTGAGSATEPSAVLLDTLASAAFFVPVIVFFLAWVLLVVILTRAPWWGYVIGGFVVGLLTYAGAIVGLLAVNAFEVAPSQVPQFLLDHALDPRAFLAFIIAREIPIWFGVWVGKRGRAVRARNAEAREEYERVLEAGPTARS